MAKILNRKGGFWLVLLMILGFTISCSKDPYLGNVDGDEPGEDEGDTDSISYDTIPCMYGTPYAEFSVTIKAVNVAGDVIGGLEVQKVEWNGVGSRLGVTNVAGIANNLQWNASDMDSIKLRVCDVDGVQNGHYKDALVRVKIDDADWKDEGDGDWSVGTIEKDITVVMTKKDE